jgi:hypothetical protein
MTGGPEFADVMGAFKLNLVKAPARRRSRRPVPVVPLVPPAPLAALPLTPVRLAADPAALAGEPGRAAHDPGAAALTAPLATGQLPSTRPATAADGSAQVFLCYSAEDRERVRRLRRCLLDRGVTCWMDVENMLPGSCWEFEIRRALRASRITLVCLSSSSVTKAGYLQREITLALERAGEQPEGGIFLIPVRLDRCEVPDRLSHLHYVDLFADDGFRRLLRTLRYTPARR